MIPGGYIQSLVDYAEIFGALGTQQIKDEITTLFAQMNAEEGKAIVNSGLNGKSFGFQVTMTVEEKFTAFVRAYKILAGAEGSSPITFLDFSGARNWGWPG
jgi:hypothetical protein